jgi:hypothetical protein
VALAQWIGIWVPGDVIDMSVTRVRRFTVKRDLIGWAVALEATARVRRVKRYFILVLKAGYGHSWFSGRLALIY